MDSLQTDLARMQRDLQQRAPFRSCRIYMNRETAEKWWDHGSGLVLKFRTITPEPRTGYALGGYEVKIANSMPNDTASVYVDHRLFGTIMPNPKPCIRKIDGMWVFYTGDEKNIKYTRESWERVRKYVWDYIWYINFKEKAKNEHSTQRHS